MDLRTARLQLVPMTLAMVEAVMLGDRAGAEALVAARMPERWPNRELIEQAFSLSLDRARANPAERLWGARVLIASAADCAEGTGDPPSGGDGAPHGARGAPSPGVRDGTPTTERRVVGSVVFRGAPDPDGICEIAYGVEERSQGRGYATEAVGASLDWALGQPGARRVQAATFSWHKASIRVLEKVGMARVGAREHETMGEMWVYERRRAGQPPHAPLGAAPRRG